jgi:hypothetical protein
MARDAGSSRWSRVTCRESINFPFRIGRGLVAFPGNGGLLISAENQHPLSEKYHEALLLFPDCIAAKDDTADPQCGCGRGRTDNGVKTFIVGTEGKRLEHGTLTRSLGVVQFGF